MLCKRTISTPAGELTLVAEDTALLAVLFPRPRHVPPCLARAEAAPLPLLDRTECWLRAYFAGAAPDPRTIPLRPQGTPFQRQVWQLLGEIPYGETTTYGALARRIAAQQGRPVMSAQAVGGAVGRNPIAILIPCHRVLSAHGPGGYGGGLWRKQLLLAREGVSMPLSE